jgi:hypothetical protein
MIFPSLEMYCDAIWENNTIKHSDIKLQPLKVSNQNMSI